MKLTALALLAFLGPQAQQKLPPVWIASTPIQGVSIQAGDFDQSWAGVTFNDEGYKVSIKKEKGTCRITTDDASNPKMFALICTKIEPAAAH